MTKPTHAIVVSARDQEVYRLECEFDYANLDACNAQIFEALNKSGYFNRLKEGLGVVFRIEPLT